MRLVIAYDGSECSAAALEDLTRAGLPREGVHATILSVDPAPSALVAPRGCNGLFSETSQCLARCSGKRASEPPRTCDSVEAAQQAYERLSQRFPMWDIERMSLAGAPGLLLREHVEFEQPDLLVVGSHNRSSMQRMLFGSVSKYLADHNTCSIRIVKSRPFRADGPPRLMIALDDSPASELSVQAIMHRTWPAGTEAKVVAVAQRSHGMDALGIDRRPFSIARRQIELEDCLIQAGISLASAGLRPTCVVKTGNAHKILEEEAERWLADCLFIGAAHHTALYRIAHRSMSSFLSLAVNCTVEIVRPRAASCRDRSRKHRRTADIVQFN